jgi:CubicO group peptidase (beta-lactamase class C family)
MERVVSRGRAHGKRLVAAIADRGDATSGRVYKVPRPLACGPRARHCSRFPSTLEKPLMSSFPLAYAPSETLGFVPQALERLTEVMARAVEEKKAPGVSMLIARHGRIAYRETVGAMRPGGPRMAEDAIFRIYSMTKPIVSVAAMMLVEEGRLLITDPVSKTLPTFANVKVGVASGDRLDRQPPRRPITVQDLMRHTSGLTYGFTGASPVQKLVKAANVADANRTLAENVEAMATLPLMHQPGEVWEYGLSTDVLGRVIEVIEGANLSEVLQARIFGPLGMADTAFFTPADQLARRADPFPSDFMGGAGVDSLNATAPPKFESGGGGLLSTLADYTRFAAMLSLGGSLDGMRILSPRTLAFMASDHLEAGVRKDHLLLWPGHGFGLGFAVRTEPGRAPTAGSVGEFFWGGMMGTAFWVSPRDSLFAVIMVQSPENRAYFRELFRNLVSAAIA